MLSKNLNAVSVISLICPILTSCTTVDRIPDNWRTDKHYGEALYFKSRCPQYNSVDMAGAVLLFCLANKAFNSGCSPDQIARNFLSQAALAQKEAKAQFDKLPTGKVCAIADARYGKSGTVFKQLLRK